MVLLTHLIAVGGAVIVVGVTAYRLYAARRGVSD
jgi:uncharacterized integral membrane protein